MPSAGNFYINTRKGSSYDCTYYSFEFRTVRVIDKRRLAHNDIHFLVNTLYDIK